MENEVKLFFGDRENLTLAGDLLATFKEQSRSGIDSKRLKIDKPGIAKDYEKISRFRVLRIK